MAYGNVRVHLQEVLILSDHTVRTFSLHHITLRDERIVEQYHFTAWPDFGVPECPTPLLRFIRKVSSSNPVGAGPMVVHDRLAGQFSAKEKLAVSVHSSGVANTCLGKASYSVFSNRMMC